MQRTNLPKEKLKSRGYLMVDKRMMELYGGNMALFMCNLIDKYWYWKAVYEKKCEVFDGSFFCRHKDIQAQIGLSDYQIRMCKQQATLKKWITIRRRGLPGRDYYEINWESPDIQIAIELFKDKSLKNVMASGAEFKGHIIITDKIKTENNSSSPEEEDILNSSGSITPDKFDKFWDAYPRKIHKGKTLTIWRSLCSKPDGDCPQWRDVYKALLGQRRTAQWENPLYIPNPVNWLNERRWMDDPATMTGVPLKDKKGMPLPKETFKNGRAWLLNNDGRYRDKNGIILDD